MHKGMMEETLTGTKPPKHRLRKIETAMNLDISGDFMNLSVYLDSNLSPGK